MLWAAMCAGFFGFMRSGKFTVTLKSHYDPEKNISLSDIAIDSHEAPTLTRLRLRHSKIDQFGHGAEIYLSKNTSPTCPLKAEVEYLSERYNN